MSRAPFTSNAFGLGLLSAAVAPRHEVTAISRYVAPLMGWEV